MPPRDPGRTGGLVPLWSLPLPAGSPEAMRRASRDGRVRNALGPALAQHLLDVKVAPDRVVLTFAGGGWDKTLTGASAELRTRLAAALGRESIILEIRAAPWAAGPQPAGTGRPADEPPPDARTRLQRAVNRILARRARER